MNRYSVLNNREILLLKGHPCFWGKCTFCDYIEDNETKEDYIDSFNIPLLDKVTGVMGTLEIINSGSCFELTPKTLDYIKSVITNKNIKTLYLESHWAYKDRLQEMRDFFGIPIIFKIGIETFNHQFRNKVLRKNAIFKDAIEVANYFDSVCLMIGIEGQTKEMITNDIDLLLKHFRYGTINIYTENTTSIKKDPELIAWFKDNYGYLKDLPDIDVLYENTDFGVG